MNSKTYTVTLRGHDYDAEGFIMNETFVLEQLVPLGSTVTQEEADKLCDELCAFDHGSEAEQDYLDMEAQVFESLADEPEFDDYEAEEE